MSEFIEKNRATIIGIAIFLILSILYSKYQDYQAQSEYEEMERVEAENNLKSQREQAQIEAQKKVQESLELQKVEEEKRKSYIQKKHDLVSTYQEIRYFFNSFKVDSLNFVQQGKYQYYLFDVYLSYNKAEQKTIFSCKSSKGLCIKYTSESSGDDFLNYSSTEKTTDQFWYTNQTITEFEKAKSAFEKYKSLVNEIKEIESENSAL
ncbi:hypothetical protein [Flectobacillus major]|uniref:hypothetical protein n=1 Tax=Flectobacillus major TaxID=103 RepID=UPI00042726FB|nr:hypothetical protein [Flectobacillus major]